MKKCLTIVILGLMLGAGAYSSSSCSAIGLKPPTKAELIEELAFWEDLADGLVMQYAAKEDSEKVRIYSNIADALQAVRTGLSPDGQLEVSLEYAVNLTVSLVEKELEDPENGAEMVALWTVLKRLQRAISAPASSSSLTPDCIKKDHSTMLW